MSESLQSPAGIPMGTLAGTGYPPTPGDTLPYAIPGTVPTATGTGWITLPPSAAPIVTVSAAYTATALNHTILCTTTSAFTVTLPPAAAVPAGFELIFKNISGSNIVTLAAGVGTDKIEGGGAGVSNTAILPAAALAFARIISDGVGNWWVIASNIPSI